MTDIFIIGAGPAGLFAAITAAESGNTKKHSIVVADANLKAGRKLGVTGNGRCNLTNMAVSSENYHGQNPLFVNGIIGKFGNFDLMDWFTGRGVEFKNEENGRVFPVTDQALTITDRLLEETGILGIRILLDTKITSLKKAGDSFLLGTSKQEEYKAQSVILATGGLTYPRLGSSGEGYEFARSFGHDIIPPVPCLTGFETLEKNLFDLQGVQVRAEVTCLLQNRTIPVIRDEVMFTHYGLSGPAVFALSSYVVRHLDAGPIALSINFFPELGIDEVEQKLTTLWNNGPRRSLGNSLTGIVPKKLAQVILRSVVKTDLDMPVSNISKDLRRAIIHAFTGLKVHLKTPRSWDDAQVTSGGVSTEKVDPRTLESKVCPGLFFAGEILDINGDCGGYNLQFAFSSGRMAGLSAAGYCH